MAENFDPLKEETQGVENNPDNGEENSKEELKRLLMGAREEKKELNIGESRDKLIEAIKGGDLYALERAPAELRADKKSVLEAVKLDGLAIRFASPELRADREVVLEAVKEDGHALSWASEELQADKEIVLETINQNGNAIQYASPELKGNREVALKAVKNCEFAIREISSELKEDYDFLLEVAKIDPNIIEKWMPKETVDKILGE